MRIAKNAGSMFQQDAQPRHPVLADCARRPLRELRKALPASFAIGSEIAERRGDEHEIDGPHDEDVEFRVAVEKVGKADHELDEKGDQCSERGTLQTPAHRHRQDDERKYRKERARQFVRQKRQPADDRRVDTMDQKVHRADERVPQREDHQRNCEEKVEAENDARLVKKRVRPSGIEIDRQDSERCRDHATEAD
ncbi:hypothetical protein Q1M65_14960 (plasmid) [Sinorhizobium meliloti]|nr:hypothetical protein Q1M65_14960 [Sinorhizobium meliloti]